MESGDSVKKVKVQNEVPPVPIKTYQWEDLKRAKEKGAYPWTYLTKGPYTESEIMDEGKEENPVEPEKKKKKPKLKKMAKVDDLSKKKKKETEHEQIPVTPEIPKGEIPLELRSEVDRKDEKTDTPTLAALPVEHEKRQESQLSTDTSEEKTEEDKEVETILKDDSRFKLEDNDEIPYQKMEEDEIPYQKMEEDEIPYQKIEEAGNSEEELDFNIRTVETSEKKEIPDQDEADKVTLTVEEAEKLSQKSGETSKPLSISTESDDTSNVEQYLDKEELSKASTTDISTLQDKPSEEPKPEEGSSKDQDDKKRKCSSTSEITKSTLSLFQKMKNSKFKPPSFKVPTFKKLAFKKSKPDSRKGSIKKEEPKTTQPIKVKKPESPVYIYIPLNPTPDELAKEKEESLKKEANTASEAKPEEPIPDTTLKPLTTPQVKDTTRLDIRAIASKWRNMQKRSDKKSPPVKKKSFKSFGKKKTSPRGTLNKGESPPKKTSPVSKKRGDTPVEYIHIPLKPPEGELKREDGDSDDSQTTKRKKNLKKLPKVVGMIEKIPSNADKKSVFKKKLKKPSFKKPSPKNIRKDVTITSARSISPSSKKRKHFPSKDTEVKKSDETEAKTDDEKQEEQLQQEDETKTEPEDNDTETDLKDLPSKEEKEETTVEKDDVKHLETLPTEDDNKTETRTEKTETKKEETETRTEETEIECKTATEEIPKKEKEEKVEECIAASEEPEKEKHQIKDKEKTKDKDKVETKEKEKIEIKEKEKKEVKDNEKEVVKKGISSIFTKKTKKPKTPEITADAPKMSLPVSKKGDSPPVEYIHIPLKGPLNETTDEAQQVEESVTENVTETEAKEELEKPNDSEIPKDDLSLTDEDLKQKKEEKEPPKDEKSIVIVTEEQPKEDKSMVEHQKDEKSTKITTVEEKIKQSDTGKKIKEATAKISKDIKILATKLKDTKFKKPELKKKSPKNGKTSPKSEKKVSGEKKSSPSSQKRNESPKYIHIPLHPQENDEKEDQSKDTTEEDAMHLHVDDRKKLETEISQEDLKETEELKTEDLNDIDAEEEHLDHEYLEGEKEIEETKDEKEDSVEQKAALPPIPKKKREKRKKKVPPSKFKVTTSKLSDDIKTLACKLKSKQAKEAKKPTTKLFRKGQKASFRSISSTSTTRSRSRSARVSTCSSDSKKDSPVLPRKVAEPVDVNTALREAAEKLQQLTPQPSPNEVDAAIRHHQYHFQEPWNFEKSDKDKTEEDQQVTKKAPKTHTSFDTLKKTKEKTKEFSRKSIKKIKDAMKPKEKKHDTKKETTKKDEKDISHKSEEELTIKTKKIEETPIEKEKIEAVVETKTEDKEDKKLLNEQTVKQVVHDVQTIDKTAKEEPLEDETVEVETLPQEVQKDNLESQEPKTKKETETKSKETAAPSKKDDDHHYEPISKEDEEDGLKIKQITKPLKEKSQQKETKQKSTKEKAPEVPIKSTLKVKDSPKMDKKVSFKEKSQSQDSDNGFQEKQKLIETIADSKDEAGYEKIQVMKEPSTSATEVKRKIESSGDAEKDEMTSPPEDYNKWSNISDHEYEPINPPPEPEPSLPAPPAVQTSVQATGPEHEQRKKKQKKNEASEPFNEKRLLRIPLDDELVVASSEDANRPSSRQEEALNKSAQERLDFSTPESSSRAEEISTSQVESSALEHLPLKKENRKKVKMAQPENQGPTMQEKIRNQADIFKTKIKGIKKPTFTIPSKLKQRPNIKKPKFQRPKFDVPKIQRPKFERPKFDTSKIKMPKMPSMPKMPKMPERPQINFPSFSLPRTKRQAQEERPVTTNESSIGSKPNIFDFRTYPRLFDKSKKSKASETATPGDEAVPSPEFATVPRATRKKGPVGARWVKRFTDIHYADADVKPTESETVESKSTERSDSLERRMAADLRYQESIEADEEMREYERENLDIHRQTSQPYPERWSHGSFHHANETTEEDDLKREHEKDGDESREQPREYDDHHQSERSSAGSSSGSRHRRGVLEEIDSDEFFLREKGISQDNIQVGLYLSSEIRDAFRQPVNSLTQMTQDQPDRRSLGSRDYEMDASDLSLTQPNRPKRKLFKKHKKIKKTPHASNEKMQYDQDSINTEPEEYPKAYKDYRTYPPVIPKRVKKSKQQTQIEPTQDDQQEEEQIIKAEEEQIIKPAEAHKRHPPIARQESDNLSLPNMVGYEDNDINIEYERYLKDERLMYENEMMKNKEQPDIVIDSGRENGFHEFEIPQKDIDKFLEDTGMMEVPKPPTRRHRSLRSLDQSEHDSILEEFNKDNLIRDLPGQEINVYRVEHEYIVPPTDEAPIAPKRVRSRSRTESQPDDDRTSRGAESIVSECQEPPCMVDLRDEMGYAIVDKSRSKPPRPPTPRRSRSLRSNKSNKSDTKFFTTPRPLNDTPPSRPSRNYSTLGPSRPPRRKSPTSPQRAQNEDKENIDISQYIEIEDEDHSRDLQSGEIISKMKDRPLPAPPRPPRKGRDRLSNEPFHDITHDDNIMQDFDETDKLTLDIPPASTVETVEEIEVSTQTDPLPDDFTCEEVVQEPTDRIVAPRRRRKSTVSSSTDPSTPKSPDRPKTPLDGSTSPHVMVIERKVQTPTVDDTTITHASLLVRPVAEYPPDSYVSQRFAADIPHELMSDTPLQSHIVYPSEDTEIPPFHEETEIQEIQKVEIPKKIKDESSLPEKDSEKLKEKVEALDDDDAEFRKNMLESVDDDLICDVVPEVIEEKIPEIPEKPQRMKSQRTTVVPEPVQPQPQIIERIIERPVPFSVTPGPDTEVEVLKAQRLQVADLDVERLNVTELQASKIMVSEIDGVSLQISELSSKSGNLIVNGLEIPSGLIQEILNKLQPVTQPAPPLVMEQVGTQTSFEKHDESKPDETQVKTEDDPKQETSKKDSSDDQTPIVKSLSTKETIKNDLISEDEKLMISEKNIIVQEYPLMIKKGEPLEKEIIVIQESPIREEVPITVETSTEQESVTEQSHELLGDPVMMEPSITEQRQVLEEGPVVMEPSIIKQRYELQAEPVVMETSAVSEIPMQIEEVIEAKSPVLKETFEPHRITKLVTELIDISESPLSYSVPIEKSETEKSEKSLKIQEELVAETPMKVIEKSLEKIVLEKSDSQSSEKSQRAEEEPISETPMEVTEQSAVEFPRRILEKSDSQSSDKPSEAEQALISLLVSEIKPEDDDDVLTQKITNLQQRIASLQERMTLVDTGSSEEEVLKDEHSSEELTLTQDIQDIIQKESDSSLKPAHDSSEHPYDVEVMEEAKHSEEKIKEDLPKESVTEKREESDPEEEEKKESQDAPKPQDSDSDLQLKKNSVRTQKDVTIQRTISQPVTTSERLPENVMGGLLQSQVLQGLPHPASYYPEYVHSVPPASFYTLRSPQAPDLSEEDIPVHPRRRRHHRHLSRSSSDEERRTVSRRHATRSPEPTIPQLTGQLARASAVSVGSLIKQVLSYVSSHIMGTPEGKQDLQIAMMILLVLIAGLILLGFGGGKTVHLHHWEYFNPPTDL